MKPMSDRVRMTMVDIDGRFSISHGVWNQCVRGLYEKLFLIVFIQIWMRNHREIWMP